MTAAIDVDGKVQGDMHAKKSIKVSQSAVVRGNIRAPSVSITEGANFNGSVTMEPSAGNLTQGSAAPGAAR
jgi:cytoskeletal protein CcmA (bactofilin family)